jgi:hypothetical protein
MIQEAEMRLPGPGDWELIRLRWAYVAGRYMKLLGGNFLYRGARWRRSWFLRRLRIDSRRISDVDLYLCCTIRRLVTRCGEPHVRVPRKPLVARMLTSSGS